MKKTIYWVTPIFILFALFSVILLVSVTPTSAVEESTPIPLPTFTPVGNFGDITVSGQVYFYEAVAGNEAPDITIYCTHFSYYYSGCAPSIMVTDDEGNFSFDMFLHDTDTVIISAEVDGFTIAEYRGSGVECYYECSSLELVLTPTDDNFPTPTPVPTNTRSPIVHHITHTGASGYVYDPDGNPVEGVEIYGYSYNSRNEDSANHGVFELVDTTDEDGRYRWGSQPYSTTPYHVFTYPELDGYIFDASAENPYTDTSYINIGVGVISGHPVQMDFTATSMVEIPDTDATCDGVWNLMDVIQIKRYDTFLLGDSIGCNASAEVQFNVTSCDINQDQKCGLVDAVIMQQCNAFIINPFCSALDPSVDDISN